MPSRYLHCLVSLMAPSSRLKVWNCRTNAVLADHARVANSFWQRFLGLMGQPGLPPGEGLWLEPCADIHSCWMRFPFDAVFLDAEGRVCHTVSEMKPWRMSPWVRQARRVLELPAGVLHETDTRPGDILAWEATAP